MRPESMLGVTTLADACFSEDSQVIDLGDISQEIRWRLFARLNICVIA
jgi:hypothetical protein